MFTSQTSAKSFLGSQQLHLWLPYVAHLPVVVAATDTYNSLFSRALQANKVLALSVNGTQMARVLPYRLQITERNNLSHANFCSHTYMCGCAKERAEGLRSVAVSRLIPHRQKQLRLLLWSKSLSTLDLRQPAELLASLEAPIMALVFMLSPFSPHALAC